MDRFEIRLSGAGGQGMILAGIIIAEAALHEEGLNVTQTQSYGPESRGGASRAVRSGCPWPQSLARGHYRP